MEGCSRDATGYVASMQLGEGGAASAQRLTDRGGERQGGELGHPVHTNLHTNLLHSVHARARSTATRSRERSVAVQEELFSYPSVCAEPGGGHAGHAQCAFSSRAFTCNTVLSICESSLLHAVRYRYRYIHVYEFSVFLTQL